MTDEERRIITAFVERISGAAPVAQAPSGPWGATGPAQRPNLPPVDPEADRLIADLFARYPEARYRITQSAFVQEAALIEANNRIQQLEWEVENARRQGQAQAAQAGGGGMFGGLFGGRSNAPMPPPMPPRPQPQYPAGYSPQALQQQSRGGMGFLGTAAAAAAGVAGGMLIGNMLMGALGGGHGAAQAASPFGTGGQDATPTSSPWTDPASATGGEKAPAESGWGQQDAAAAQDASATDQDAWGAQDDGGDWGGDEEI
ncbi:DUF2076 domain-containing protein [Roseomonas eburnea]|uniref:DUF2076 domain-containing protein n=1 Tax=Neoroseomonas eburnea TaxID=1346889 RepID=A0A9X9X7Z0_9PROT|nr:DUF2076 family protein [Neoroseomonas eburnea]MBR0679826.1 DUF2076 domain-containing protein [Neoroseomonas eburnea]